MTEAVFDFEDIARRLGRKPEPEPVKAEVSLVRFFHNMAQLLTIVQWSSIGNFESWDPDLTVGSCDVS